MSCQKNRRWKLRGKAIGKVEVNIEAAKVAPLLTKHSVDLQIRKDLAAGSLLNMGQGHEALRQQAPLSDLVRGHGSQLIPGNTCGQLHPDATLDRLSAAGHHDSGDRTIRQVIALFEDFPLALQNAGFIVLILRLDGS